jgi:hypothetical protein
LSENDTLIEAVAEYARRTYLVCVSDREALVKPCTDHLRPSENTDLMNLQRLRRIEETAT